MNSDQRRQRIIELLEKEDFAVKDYDELMALVKEIEQEHYLLRERYKDSMYATK